MSDTDRLLRALIDLIDDLDNVGRLTSDGPLERAQNLIKEFSDPKRKQLDLLQHLRRRGIAEAEKRDDGKIWYRAAKKEEA